MSKIKQYLLLASASLLLAPNLFSCAKAANPDTLYLKILNSEDYISDRNYDVDLISQFEEEMTDKYGKSVKIIYDTFDTMENMYNVINTGKTKYDLICASDYMIQKLANNSLIQELDHSRVPYYDNEEADEVSFKDEEYDPVDVYASPFIRDQLKSDTWKLPNDNLEYKAGDEVNLDQYCECYMWGSVGILYNPAALINKGTSEDEFIEDMDSFSNLWNPKYNKLIAIKDSMRDTYAIGLIKRYEDEFNAINENDELTKEEKKAARQKIFDRGGEEDELAQEHINEVRDVLLELRSNIFGFEVDSGKQDIVSKKIAIDTAWSGDAVWAIDEAAEVQEYDSSVPDLYYSVPSEGSNIWFDCWAMQPNNNDDLAYDFLNFIARPDSVMANYDAIGYTSAIAGDDVFDMYYDWFEEYDIASEWVNDLSELDIEDFEEEDAVGVFGSNPGDPDFYYEVVINENDEKEWCFIRLDVDTHDDLNELDIEDLEDGVMAYVFADEEEDDAETYYEYDDGEWSLLGYNEYHDLSYFFDTDTNSSFKIPSYEISVISDNLSSRELSAQFPDTEVIDNLMIMRDYGKNNELITKMWEEVKHDNLPTWAIVLFSVEAAAVIGLVTFFVIYKYRNKNRRKKRRLKNV